MTMTRSVRLPAQENAAMRKRNGEGETVCKDTSSVLIPEEEDRSREGANGYLAHTREARTF